MSTPGPDVEGASREDVVEQDTPVVPDPVSGVALPLEAPDADVAEQAADARLPATSTGADLPLEADPADAAEQEAVVQLDEDEHR